MLRRQICKATGNFSLLEINFCGSFQDSTVLNQKPGRTNLIARAQKLVWDQFPDDWTIPAT
jgi:hypothetical protein